MAKDAAKRIAELKAQRDKISDRLRVAESKARTQDRKLDARRKIVVGAAVIAHMEHDASFAQLMSGLLKRLVTRPADIAVIEGLLPQGLPERQFDQVRTEVGGHTAGTSPAP